MDYSGSKSVLKCGESMFVRNVGIIIIIIIIIIVGKTAPFEPQPSLEDSVYCIHFSMVWTS
jgi:hypothetical protein